MKNIFLLFLLFSFIVHAGPREQAYVMHNRIVGIPPQKPVLDQMENLIASGLAEDAARVAMQNPRFYSLQLKRWAKPWSNEDQSERVELNDFVALIIGAIRDDIRFDRILYDDIAYSGPDNLYDNDNDDFREERNNHFSKMENEDRNLMNLLVQRTQSERYTSVQEHAGIFTTRAYGNAFYNGGTNRAVTRFTFINFLCRDFEELHDITVPDFRVRRDVERSPGGDSRVYRNKCVGCHAGQDALGGAFVRMDWDGNNLVQVNNVVNKINMNNNFSEGYLVTDDTWINLWANGQNSALGWRGAVEGRGAKAFGQMIGRSRAFAVCMARKAYKLVCHKEPDADFRTQLANTFEQNSRYSMKTLIAKSAVNCMGDE